MSPYCPGTDERDQRMLCLEGLGILTGFEDEVGLELQGEIGVASIHLGENVYAVFVNAVVGTCWYRGIHPSHGRDTGRETFHGEDVLLSWP